MSSPDWPSPEQQQQPQQRPLPLPRVEDLPVAEQGYDREAVREAFDSFYRHAAQLDTTLRTLETVEVFQRTASELRAELRTVRAAGWTVSGYQRGGGYGGARSSVREWSLPPAFPRVAAEALFLIVVGVIVGVAGWSRIAIVLVMALALAIVWLVEWVAARERAIPQATAAPPVAPRLDEAEEPGELPAPDAAGWSAFSEHEEGPEAMTMLSAEPVRVAAEDEPDEEAPAEPDVIPELVPVTPAVTPMPAPIPPERDEPEASAEPVRVAAEDEPDEEAPAEPDVIPELVPVTPAVTPMPAPVAPEPEDEDEAEASAEVVEEPVALEDPVPVEPPAELEPEEPEEPEEHEELEAVAKADVAAEPVAEARADGRRFRFWRRGATAETPEPIGDELVADVTVAEAEVEPEPADEFVAPTFELGSEHVDPWEREAELPLADVEIEDGGVEEEEEAEPAAAASVEDSEPEPPRRFRWFRRALSSEVVAEPEPERERDLEPELLEAIAEPEPEEPVEAAFDEGDEVDEEAEELELELGEPDEPEPVLEHDEPDEADEDEPAARRELPVEVVAEQAEAALARSRARRRAPRRARRR